jgi:lysozyme
MKVKRLMGQLQIDEGVKLRVYLDHLGLPTVGIGHLIKESTPDEVRNLEVGDKITIEQCEQLFREDLKSAIEDAMVIFEGVWEEFPEMAQEVFINMLFNLGRYRFMKFKKTILAAYAQDWQTVSVEMMDSRWARQVGQRAVRLSQHIARL